MKNEILCLNMAVCSSWGRRLPKHIFKTQYARKNGHKNCLNCGMTLGEVRKEEQQTKQQLIETRHVDFHSNLEKPVYLTQKDLQTGNYKVFI